MSTAGAKRIRVTIDKVKDIAKGLETLASVRVMAGVPSTKAPRTDEGQPINNAQLMYIHENGAPEINLPARPVVHPAIKEVQPHLIAIFEGAAHHALAGNKEAVMQDYNAAGIVAQNAMRKRITDGPFAPLSPRTIAARAAKAGRGRRKGEQQYLDLVKSGVSALEAQNATGIKPLIDTGQLRRALTYVIRQITWNGKLAAQNLGRKK